MSKEDYKAKGYHSKSEMRRKEAMKEEIQDKLDDKLIEEIKRRDTHYATDVAPLLDLIEQQQKTIGELTTESGAEIDKTAYYHNLADEYAEQIEKICKPLSNHIHIGYYSMGDCIQNILDSPAKARKQAFKEVAIFVATFDPDDTSWQQKRKHLKERCDQYEHLADVIRALGKSNDG